MSATAIDIHVWIEAQHDAAPAHIHPSARGICRELTTRCNGRLVYLLQQLRWKIADGAAWEERSVG